MTRRLDFPVDDAGNIVGQKVVVGCDKGHRLSGRQRPFPDRGVNWVGENRFLVRIRVKRRLRGQAFPLDDALV